ncbi:hypothetical protein JCM6882_003315 [Rhodosporidiobolus microsporus]
MPSSTLCSLSLSLVLSLTLFSLTLGSPVGVLPPSPQTSVAAKVFPHVFPRAAEGTKCAKTADCTARGYEIPRFAHYLCVSRTKECGWACNTGYTPSGNSCVSLTVTTSTAQAAKTQTCSKSADCSNVVPANANRYCAGGVCSFRCRTGFTRSGDKCINPAASSSSSSTVFSSTATAPPVLVANPSSTCKVTADCAQTVPANANRYCDKGACSWRCKTGYTSNGSTCTRPGATSSSPSSSRMSTTTRPAATTTTTTTSTSAAAAVATCAKTADCDGRSLPSNAHAYCGNRVCSFRCNTGYSVSSDGKGCERPAGSSSSSSSSSSTTAAPTTTTTTSANPTSSSSSGSATITSSASASSQTTTSVTTTTTETTSKYTWNNTPTRTFSTAPTPPAAVPQLRTSYTGQDFFDPLKFWTFNYTDPTEGSVNYLQPPDLSAQNLTSLPSPSVARLSVDSFSPLALGENRDSVRISSVETVDPGSLVIADFGHIPAACGAWPAFWLYSDPWPENGEIDVLETVNLRSYNSMTLHTVSGCARNPNAEMTGTWAYSSSRVSCDAEIGSSCAAQDPGPDAVGTGFNAAGGGVFAVQIAETGISIWRWNRANIPADVVAGEPRPQSWGLPVAVWDGSTCDTRTYFSKLWITLNITICGRMAGKTSTWRSASGSGSCYPRYATCADAAMDPAAFSEAYFDVNYIKVFSV